jgi:hypothetical protein
MLVTSIALIGCPNDDPTSLDGSLVTGTWGGENVALLVESGVAHVHIGCTNGDFEVPLRIDQENRVNVAGSYLLRAYPVAIGPTLPAQLAGVLRGRQLTFTVSVNDTVEKKLVVLGPVTVFLGTEPRLGPCPVCDRRGTRIVIRPQRSGA